MAASKTVIANMALRHIKVSKEIGNLDTDQSAEAEAIRVFYETLQMETLRACYWSFATKYVALSLVQQKPTNEWAFSYRYPSDCVRVRRILNPQSRVDTRQSRVPYLMASDPTGLLIYCDLQGALAEYTYFNTTESYYPSDFVLALSFHIASYVAPSLTGGDPFKLGDKAMAMYLDAVTRAAANIANEDQPDMLPDAELIIGRN